MVAADLRILIVDLNNFARYPTIAVGYLAAILRQAQMQVQVLSPLAAGVAGVVREPRAKPWGFVDQWMRYRTAVSTSPLVRNVRDRLAARHAPRLAQQTALVADQLAERITKFAPDAVLISTYLMYYPLCQQLAAICKNANIPVLLGGPYFAQPEVVDEWIDMEGVAGIVGAEVEPILPQLVRAVAARSDLSQFPGMWTRNTSGNAQCTAHEPLKDLDALPMPCFDDFPWDRYPNRIIPLITGRGCAWGACTFCSDVTSTAGRTYRSRGVENVLAEIEHQSRRHATNLLAFVDLKLNSNPGLWRALLDNMQRVAPNAQWIGALHVDAKIAEQLATEMPAARAAGMVRLTTGLESGSQRILDSMCKGTDLALTSRFLRAAKNAGISVRTTMILGYPGEDAGDVELSAKFVEEHIDCIERVSLNRMQIMTGTRFHRAMERQANSSLTQVTVNHRMAQVDHHYVPTETRPYRRAVTRLLSAVHRINRRPLAESARQFEGVM